MKFTKYMFNFPHEATKQILLYNAFSGALALIESENGKLLSTGNYMV